MDQVSSLVDRPPRLAQRIALEVDQHEVRGSDFAIVQAERVDEETDFGARHSRSDVIEDQLIPAEHVEDAIAGGELHARLALGVRHRQLDVAAQLPRVIDGHGASLLSIKRTAVI